MEVIFTQTMLFRRAHPPHIIMRYIMSTDPPLSGHEHVHVYFKKHSTHGSYVGWKNLFTSKLQNCYRPKDLEIIYIVYMYPSRYVSSDHWFVIKMHSLHFWKIIKIPRASRLRGNIRESFNRKKHEKLKKNDWILVFWQEKREKLKKLVLLGRNTGKNKRNSSKMCQKEF
jgi:hypothetical protein